MVYEWVTDGGLDFFVASENVSDYKKKCDSLYRAVS